MKKKKREKENNVCGTCVYSPDRAMALQDSENIYFFLDPSLLSVVFPIKMGRKKKKKPLAINLSRGKGFLTFQRIE